MADKRISELNSITGANTASGDLFVIVDVDASETKKITRDELTNALELTDFDNIDINGGTIDSTTIGGSTPAAGSFTTGQFDTSLNVDGTVTADAVVVGDDQPISLRGGNNSFDDLIADSTDNVTILRARNDLRVNIDSNGDSTTLATFVIGYDEIDATSKKALQVLEGGDISFYDSTGVSQSLFWDASAESLGVGTSSPSDYFTGATDLVISGSGDAGLTIDAGTSSYSRVHFADGTSGNEAYRGFVVYEHSNDSMQFGTGGGSEAMRIDSSGNLDLTNGGGNIIMASGAGIDFSATGGGSGTATSALLDDYEEGTWEPVLEGATGNPSVTYNGDTGGFYIKTGRMVYLTGCVRTTAISGGSGTLLIAGLPFSISARSNGDNADGAGAVRTVLWNGTASKHPTIVHMRTGNPNLNIGSGDADQATNILQVSDWGSTCMIQFTCVIYTS